jgi:hypothetical protein
MGDSEVRDPGIPSGAIGRSRRQRQSVPLTERRAQNRIDEARGMTLIREPRQVDRIVHDRRRGNPIEVKKLIEAEPENIPNAGVDPIE